MTDIQCVTKVQTSAHRPSSDDEPSPSRPLDPSVIAALEAPISDLSPAVQQLLEQEIENIAEEQKKEEEVQKVQEQLAAERANPQVNSSAFALPTQDPIPSSTLRPSPCPTLTPPLLIPGPRQPAAQCSAYDDLRCD